MAEEDVVHPSITAGCTGNLLMLACRSTGSSTIIAAAYAPRADVFDTGFSNVTHNESGVGWWGFVRAGDTVDRSSCDTDSSGANAERMCWHTGGGSIDGGYRCGVDDGLNGSTTYERLVYTANQ